MVLEEKIVGEGDAWRCADEDEEDDDDDGEDMDGL